MAKWSLAIAIILIAHNRVYGFAPRRHVTFGKVGSPSTLDSYLDDLFGAEPIHFSQPPEPEPESEPSARATGNYLERLQGAPPLSYSTYSAPAEPAPPATGNYMDALAGAQPISFSQVQPSTPVNPVTSSSPVPGNYMDALAGAAPISFSQVQPPAPAAPATPSGGSYMDALSEANPISFTHSEVAQNTIHSANPGTYQDIPAAFVSKQQYAPAAPNTGSYLDGLSQPVKATGLGGYTSFLDTLSATKAAHAIGTSRSFLDSLSNGHVGTLSGPSSYQALSFLDSLAEADPLPSYPQAPPAQTEPAVASPQSTNSYAPITGSYLDALSAMTPQKVVGYLDSISRGPPNQASKTVAPMESYLDSLQDASNFDSIEMVSNYLDSLGDSSAVHPSVNSYHSQSSPVADSAVSHQSRKVELLRETLEESKMRSMERVDASIFERQQAEYKIAMMEQKYNEEKLKIESELDLLMLDNQNRINEDFRSISQSLRAKVEMHKVRQTELQILIQTLLSSITTKEAEVARVSSILKELEVVRNKTKYQSIAQQLDNVIEKKTKVKIIEQRLVEDLVTCVTELENIVGESKERAMRIEGSINRFVQPHGQMNVQQEWNEIDAMEQNLGKAAEDILAYESKIFSVKSKIDEALANKSALLESSMVP